MVNIGQKLKEARLNKNLDIEDVSLATKITKGIIKALEENRAEEIVNFIYARSFLKSYANFLGLNGNELAESFLKSKGPKEQTKPLYLAVEKPNISRINILRNSLAIILIILVVISAIYSLGWLLKKSTKAKRQRPKVALIKNKSTPSIFPIPKNKPIILVLSTKDKVWVQLKSDGRIITQNVLKENTIETWKANERFELWIGKPDAVKLKINGKLLTLPKNKKIKGLIINRKGIKF